MHMRRMLVFFFGKSTGFATQVACLICRINLAARSRLISSPMALRFGLENRHIDCLIGLASGYTSRECSANSLGMPGMSAGHQAKISQNSRRNSMSALSYAGERLVDTIAVLEASVGCTWCALVSLVALNSISGVVFLLRGRMEWSVDFASCASSSCIPDNWEILLKSVSQLSEHVNLPLMVIVPLGPGIFNLR